MLQCLLLPIFVQNIEMVQPHMVLLKEWSSMDYLAPTKRFGVYCVAITHCENTTITLQALSVVEKAEPVQVHFTLRLGDQYNT